MESAVRVLHVIGSMDRGGAETFLMNVYREIDRTKVQFDFLISSPTKTYYEDEIIALGGNIHRMPRRIPNYPKHCKFIDSFFKNNKYQIVHQHSNSCVAISTLIYAKKNKVNKIIFHSHSSKTNGNFSDKLFDFIYKSKIKKYATDYFACSELAGENLFGKYIDKDQIKIINNGIRTENYAFNKDVRAIYREKLGISDKFVVGHVGNFTAPKNHSFLIDVFSEIYNMNNNSVLLLVGDGSLRKEAEYKVAKLGLADRVIFADVRSDIQELLCAMDVFVFPSLYEGLGIVLIEAQTCGLRCISSNVIPREAQVTNLLECISLDETSKVWAAKVISSSKLLDRKTMSEAVALAGFDAKDVAFQLQKLYLDR